MTRVYLYAVRRISDGQYMNGYRGFGGRARIWKGSGPLKQTLKSYRRKDELEVIVVGEIPQQGDVRAIVSSLADFLK